MFAVTHAPPQQLCVSSLSCCDRRGDFPTLGYLRCPIEHPATLLPLIGEDEWVSYFRERWWSIGVKRERIWTASLKQTTQGTEGEGRKEDERGTGNDRWIWRKGERGNRCKRRKRRKRNERWGADVQRDACPDRARMRQRGECGTFSCTSSVYE